jgi:hypothetical protein
MEVVVGRLGAGGWDLKVFKLPGALSSPRVAVNDAGEILLAADYFHGNVDDIYAAIAPSLSAPWPALGLVSPVGGAAQQYRDPFVAAGGSAFAIGWGVHGGSNQRTEVISTKPAGAACGGTGTPTPTPTASATATATATPTATATATPSATPDPLPLPAPSPTAVPATVPAPAATAFVALPSASKCVRRGGKLTVRFPKPPAGQEVQAVTVKLNAKRLATLKGKTLQKPFYVRKLPKRSFSITVSVSLRSGQVVTGRRRYTVCR